MKSPFCRFKMVEHWQFHIVQIKHTLMKPPYINIQPKELLLNNNLVGG